MIFFDVATNTAALDDADVLETTFQIRQKIIDPYSEHATLNVVYAYTEVVFNNECDPDTFTHNSNGQLGLQTFTLGQGTTTVANNIQHSLLNCPYTWNLYEWTESTKSWGEVACDGSHDYISSCAMNTMNIGGMSAATKALYTPDGYVTLKWRWEATLSEMADDVRIIEDEFQIYF